LFLVGLFPLGASVIETYIQNTAKRELRRQYDYMYDVFRSAHDQLLQANSDNERRTILALLGHAALSEHAEWLFLHRDRPIDRNRMQ
jgi:triphosphoribosyl-dephospho-CoA synthetase